MYASPGQVIVQSVLQSTGFVHVLHTWQSLQCGLFKLVFGSQEGYWRSIARAVRSGQMSCQWC